MKVLFLRPSTAFLPEVDAYEKALNEAGISVEIKTSDYSPAGRQDVDLVYRFGGFLPRNVSDIPEIHEYSSASTGYLPHAKNLTKSLLNSRPAGRVFLSEFVHRQFRFHDTNPHILRDMGVNTAFFEARGKATKDFDLVYVGSIEGRKNVLDILTSLGRSGYQIGVASKVNSDTARQLSSAPGIDFVGAIPQSDVPRFIARATHGLNLIPDIYPFNRQTSTKVLEYLAAGLTVVSNTYDWIDKHSQELNYRFIPLGNLETSTPSKLAAMPNLDFEVVRRFEWDSVLKSSGFVQFIHSVIGL